MILPILTLLLFAAGLSAQTIAIIGDSTVCDCPTSHACRGWGQFLGDHLKESARVINLAKSGRSTKTFIQEGLWNKTIAQKPDFILIQFGHNDSHGPGKSESTDAATSYRDFLHRYIREARAAGVIPVLVTPMHRRTFKERWLEDILKPYADAMKAVAMEQRVDLVDLHTSSGKLFAKLGAEKSAEFASTPTDRTHFNERGAKAMAELVAKELPTAEHKLKPLFR